MTNLANRVMSEYPFVKSARLLSPDKRKGKDCNAIHALVVHFLTAALTVPVPVPPEVYTALIVQYGQVGWKR